MRTNHNEIVENRHLNLLTSTAVRICSLANSLIEPRLELIEYDATISSPFAPACGSRG
jgi:hypothetical protein